MKLKSFVTVCAASTLMMTMSAQVVAADSFNGTQKKSIETIVHDYLIQNPEVLVEASQNLQKKQQEAMAEQAKAAIADHAAQIFGGSAMTTVGNPKGNVTIVEFFDYQCIHCKKMSPVVNELIKKDSNVRVVYKEFPIFGKSSETASKAALAAAMQGKYEAMHDALIGQEKGLTDEMVMNIAKSLGLNMTKFDADMKSKAVTEQLDANRQLAEQLRLMGTPAFIVGSTPAGQFKSGSQPAFVPGAISLTSLQDLIKKAGTN